MRELRDNTVLQMKVTPPWSQALSCLTSRKMCTIHSAALDSRIQSPVSVNTENVCHTLSNLRRNVSYTANKITFLTDREWELLKGLKLFL